jgi:hypothetical protein
MACCVSTSPRAPTCPCTARPTFAPSRSNSTNARAEDTGLVHHPRRGLRTRCHAQHLTVLRRSPEIHRPRAHRAVATSRARRRRDHAARPHPGVVLTLLAAATAGINFTTTGLAPRTGRDRPAVAAAESLAGIPCGTRPAEVGMLRRGLRLPARHRRRAAIRSQASSDNRHNSPGCGRADAPRGGRRARHRRVRLRRRAVRSDRAGGQHAPLPGLRTQPRSRSRDVSGPRRRRALRRRFRAPMTPRPAAPAGRTVARRASRIHPAVHPLTAVAPALTPCLPREAQMIIGC